MSDDMTGREVVDDLGFWVAAREALAIVGIGIVTLIALLGWWL
jgi:hypothetical protein